MASSIVLSDNGVTSGSAGIKSTGGNDGVLLLQTTTAGGVATTAVTVDNAQNVGVGVTPSAWGSGWKSVDLSSTASFATNGSTAILANNYFYNGTNVVYKTTNYATRYIQDATAGTHAWYNAASGTAGNTISFTQAMTLDANGALLVGTTDASPTTGNGVKIIKDRATTSGYNAVSVVSNASSSAYSTYELYTASGGAGYKFYVAYNGTISAVTTTITAISDQRLKENIRDLDDGLEKVMALKPRKFDWKENKGANTKDARGFIAQEFETVFPDMIEEWKDPAPEGEEPYKAVNANLIPTLVKAIQEQQALIQSLTDRLTALEGASK
jgi:hypothetical protein